VGATSALARRSQRAFNRRERRETPPRSQRQTNIWIVGGDAGVLARIIPEAKVRCRPPEPWPSLFREPTSVENQCMNRVVISFLLLLSICSQSFAHQHKKHPRTVDPLYGSALAAANRFLHAWQSEDHETGIMMLSDSARQSLSPDKLQNFFSPGPDAAYEISRGKRVNSAAYEFPVVLFGVSSAPSRPHECTMIVSRSGKSEWAVDKIP
jgi:hypothetical protein